MKTIATLVLESGFEFKFNNTTDFIIEMLWTESVDSDTFNEIWYETEEDRRVIEKALSENAHFTKNEYCWTDLNENTYFLTTL